MNNIEMFGNEQYDNNDDDVDVCVCWSSFKIWKPRFLSRVKIIIIQQCDAINGKN